MAALHELQPRPICRDGHDVFTTLNYMIPPGREGLQPITSDAPGVERRNAQREGITDVREVVIKDLRGREDEFSLKVQGFQYVKHPVDDVTDWRNQTQVEKIVQPATKDLIKRVTGASEVIVYLTRTRFEGNRNGNKMSTLNSPSHGVHTDMTHASCRHVLKGIVPDDEIERLMGCRFDVINVWRPIKPILRDPLAVCDWRSVDPDSDIFPDRRVISGQVFEFGMPVFNDKHAWYYLSVQQPDEPLLFNQLSSDVASSMTVLHSAFVDPSHNNETPRESIEMKCFAFYTGST
ncbi:hypothetical protein MYU51_020687 [Penicillium brevicompactum]